jgi:hypothetical protein
MSPDPKIGMVAQSITAGQVSPEIHKWGVSEKGNGHYWLPICYSGTIGHSKLWGTPGNIRIVSKNISDTLLERNLRSAINSSKWILDLDDNFDGEGSIGFKEATWKRAVDYVEKQMKVLWMNGLNNIDVPRILPATEGNIAIHWKNPRYELLITIPAESDKPATFYGDNYGELKIKGSFPLSNNNPCFLDWFKQV